MRHPESKLQQSCVHWFRLQHSRYARCFFAIPNGGARSKVEASIMQGEGVTPGVADTFLMVANTRFHGLFIEFKHGKGKQSDNQVMFQAAATLQGYDYVVVRSFDEFVDVINHYLYS